VRGVALLLVWQGSTPVGQQIGRGQGAGVRHTGIGGERTVAGKTCIVCVGDLVAHHLIDDREAVGGIDLELAPQTLRLFARLRIAIACGHRPVREVFCLFPQACLLPSVVGQ